MKNNINQILEKYWNAETSLQEEAELRSYFSGDDVAQEHIQYRDLFTFFSVGRLQSTSLEVDEVLSKLSDIDSILEKYWNAEASLEEEAQLRDYFNGDSVAQEHLQYKDLFTFYEVYSAQVSDVDINQVIDENTNIDVLLDKYWNTETSLEEEKIIKAYFSSDKIDDKHLAYGGLFDSFSLKSSVTTDLDVREILMKAERQEEKRTIGSPVIIQETRTKVFSLQKWAVGIAAVFVMGFAAVTVMNPTTKTQYKGQATVLDEEAEAQEAYEITKEALAFLSKNMRKGSKTVVESVNKAEKVSIFK